MAIKGGVVALHTSTRTRPAGPSGHRGGKGSTPPPYRPLTGLSRPFQGLADGSVVADVCEPTPPHRPFAIDAVAPPSPAPETSPPDGGATPTTDPPIPTARRPPCRTATAHQGSRHRDRSPQAQYCSGRSRNRRALRIGYRGKALACAEHRFCVRLAVPGCWGPQHPRLETACGLNLSAWPLPGEAAPTSLAAHARRRS